jgi:hypothetical protein
MAKTKQPTDEQIERAVCLLVSGVAADEAAVRIARRWETSHEVAARAVEVARERLTAAAEFNRDEQVNVAYRRLNDVYRGAIDMKDPRTALAAQKELNKLLSLYGDAEGEIRGGGDGEAERELQLIASYLLPLNLADPRLPLSEHVRIATQRLRSYSAVPCADLSG